MAIKFSSVLLAILMGSILNEFSAALGEEEGTRLGGYRPIKNIDDPLVIEIGKFAVAEHNKQAKDELQFLKVVKGETQVVSGTNYKLFIATKIENRTINCSAVVFDKPWEKYRELTSFTKLV